MALSGAGASDAAPIRIWATAPSTSRPVAASATLEMAWALRAPTLRT